MVSKHKQKKEKNFRNYGKSNKELKKEILNICKKQEKEENGEEASKCRFPTMKVKKVSPVWQKAWKVEKSYPLVLNEK